ncbi:copper-transporting ATPase HMA4, partial [Tanacetum coccineum]
MYNTTRNHEDQTIIPLRLHTLYVLNKQRVQGNNPTSPRNGILGLGVQVNPLLLGMQVNFPPPQSLGVQVKHFVIGGTVNENGCLLIKATHVGSETALSQIVQIVEAAQLARAPVQKLADRISKFFVPAVVVAAVVTFLGWFIPGVAGIYPKSWTPKAMDEFEVALQFGASEGVLIKGGNALEKAHKLNWVAMWGLQFLFSILVRLLGLSFILITSVLFTVLIAIVSDALFCLQYRCFFSGGDVKSYIGPGPVIGPVIQIPSGFLLLC